MASHCHLGGLCWSNQGSPRSTVGASRITSGRDDDCPDMEGDGAVTWRCLRRSPGDRCRNNLRGHRQAPRAYVAPRLDDGSDLKQLLGPMDAVRCSAILAFLLVGCCCCRSFFTSRGRLCGFLQASNFFRSPTVSRPGYSSNGPPAQVRHHRQENSVLVQVVQAMVPAQRCATAFWGGREVRAHRGRGTVHALDEERVHAPDSRPATIGRHATRTRFLLSLVQRIPTEHGARRAHAS